MKTAFFSLSTICLIILGTASNIRAQFQTVNTSNLQLQQAISNLKVIQALPLTAAALNDTTSNFTITANNRRVYAEGHATASTGKDPLEYLMISDYKDTLISGSMKHFAYQTLRLTSANLLRSYANKMISSSSTLNAPFTATTRSSNFRDEIIEVRNYSNAKVVSIEFPKLEASERAVPTEFKVVLDAASVTSTYPGGTETTKRSVLVPGISLTSFFNTTISGINNSTTTRIAAISPIKISATAAAQRYQLSDFTIDVGTSFAQEFAQWIQSPGRATDLRTIRIAYMNGNLQTELLVLELLEVEIISMNNLPVTGNQIPKTRIGFRPKRINVRVN